MFAKMRNWLRQRPVFSCYACWYSSRRIWCVDLGRIGDRQTSNSHCNNISLFPSHPANAIVRWTHARSGTQSFPDPESVSSKSATNLFLASLEPIRGVGFRSRTNWFQIWYLFVSDRDPIHSPIRRPLVPNPEPTRSSLHWNQLKVLVSDQKLIGFEFGTYLFLIEHLFIPWSGNR